MSLLNVTGNFEMLIEQDVIVDNSSLSIHHSNMTCDQNCFECYEVLEGFSWELDTNNLYHPVFVENSNLTDFIKPNFSDYDFPSKIWLHKPIWEVTLGVLAFIPFVLVGVLGNGLIIYVVAARCVLRTSTNLLLGNLAFADMLTLIFCPGMFLVTASFQNYVMGRPGCKMEGFVNCCFLLTAVLNIIAVSYDRLTAMALPHEARLSLKGTYIIMIGTWTLGIGFSLPFLVYRLYKERQWANFLEKYCTENLTVLAYYWNVVIVLMVWLPLTIMIVCYTCIVTKLHFYEQEVMKRENTRASKWKVKVIRTMFVLLIVFILLRVPYTALIFWRFELLRINKRNQITADNFLVLWLISRYLIFINAAINPFIYGFSNENFKRAVRRMEVSKWLFSGTSGSSVVTAAPHKKEKHMAKEEKHIYQEDPKEQPVLQNWSKHTLEGKIKTDSTECHI